MPRKNRPSKAEKRLISHAVQSTQPQKRLWAPQPGPQTEAIMVTWCRELLFGGARGGGKSDYMLGDFLQDVPTYGPHWHGILLRRTYPELRELIKRSHEFYPDVGGVWKEGKHEWQFPNGATLLMAYAERPEDVSRFQGSEFGWIGFDELGNWPSDEGYRMMLATNRSSHDVPTKRIRSTANPGGPGHKWIQQRFVDFAPLGMEVFDDPQTGMSRMYIPSKVTDNKILLARDPQYVELLRGVGSPELVRAWLEGDWSAVPGAYFTEFSLQRHVVRPFEIPSWWTKFRCMDWGYARPFCVHWVAVSDGCYEDYPAGALVFYREWFGEADNDVNKGLRLDVSAVARGIVEKTPKEERIAYTVVDPSMYKEDGGPCLAESLNKSAITVRRGDNQRVPGWNECRRRLCGDPVSGKPLVFLFSTCTGLIKTLPILQHDRKKLEDLDSSSSDDAADSMRYGIMSRMWVSDKPEEEKIRGMNEITFQEMLDYEKNYTRTEAW